MARNAERRERRHAASAERGGTQNAGIQHTGILYWLAESPAEHRTQPAGNAGDARDAEHRTGNTEHNGMQEMQDADNALHGGRMFHTSCSY